MATEEELSRALVNADRAGDVDAAKALAAEITRMRSAPQKSFPERAFGYVDNLVRQAANGITANYADEIAARANQIFGRGDYTSNVAEERARDKAFEAENPVAATVANMAGAVAVPGVGAAKILGSQAVRQAPRMVKALAYPAVGAVEGAIAGSGGAVEGERLEGAGTGAAVGGAVGAALPAVGAVVRKGIVDPIRARVGRGGAKVGQEYVERALQRDAMTPETALARMQQMGPGASLADTGKNVSGLAEVVTNRPGKGMAAGLDFVEGRRGGQVGRILQKLDDAIGPTGREVMERVEDSPAFTETLKTRIPVTREMVNVLNRPSMRSAWEKAQTLAAEKDMALPSFDEFAKGARAGEIKEVETTLLHWLKKGLDDVLEPKRDQVTGFVQAQYGKNELAAKNETRTAFRSMVKSMNEDYGKALDRMSAEFRVDDALKKGRDFFRLRSPADVQKQMARMTDREKRAYLNGIREAIETKAEGPGVVGYDVTGMVLKQAPKLRAAFGDKADDLINSIKTERTFAETERRIAGNSRTAFRQEAAKDFEGGMRDPAGAMMDVATGNKVGMANRALRWAVDKATQPPKAAADEAAGMLFETDRDKLARLLMQGRAGSQAPVPDALIRALMGGAAVTAGGG